MVVDGEAVVTTPARAVEVLSTHVQTEAVDVREPEIGRELQRKMSCRARDRGHVAVKVEVETERPGAEVAGHPVTDSFFVCASIDDSRVIQYAASPLRTYKPIVIYDTEVIRLRPLVRRPSPMSPVHPDDGNLDPEQIVVAHRGTVEQHGAFAGMNAL